jgi:hypothetical protein
MPKGLPVAVGLSRFTSDRSLTGVPRPQITPSLSLLPDFHVPEKSPVLGATSSDNP